jgi:hypothetical protein
MRSLCIVPCGKEKVWKKNPTAGPTPAKLVYTGPFAVKCRQYAERFYPLWCILSAKYGFLFPDDIVPGPYNVTFNKRKTNPIGPEALSTQVKERGLDVYEQIVVVAGRDYVQIVRQAMTGKSIHAPLSECKGNGYMMRELNKTMAEGLPL